LAQRVFQIAAGYEDCNDCNDLREDMIFKMCVGRFPQSDNDLASQPTMSRLENTVKKTDLFRLFLHSMAYILIHTLQKQVLKGSEYANATMKTIQLKIIKTAAWERYAKAEDFDIKVNSVTKISV
jgi:DDE family transposase